MRPGRCRAPRNATVTWSMPARDLARVVANHQGWITDGGWIMDASVTPIVPIAQGYDELALVLTDCAITVEGLGIDWAMLRDHTTADLRRWRLKRRRRNGGAIHA